jgi:hypothetical protein
VLVNLCHGIDGAGFPDVEANDFDGVLLLIDVVYCFVDFAKTSLANLDNIFEFLLESSCVKNVVKW